MIFKEDSPNLKKDHLIPIIFSIILFIKFINRNSTIPDIFYKIVTNYN
jgi:hypothetical protein